MQAMIPRQSMKSSQRDKILIFKFGISESDPMWVASAGAKTAEDYLQRGISAGLSHTK